MAKVTTDYQYGQAILNRFPSAQYYNATVAMLLVARGWDKSDAAKESLRIRDTRSLKMWCENNRVTVESFVAVENKLAELFEAWKESQYASENTTDWRNWKLGE